MPKTDWPKWQQPTNDEMLVLAKTLIPYVKIIHPKIVALVVKENNKKRDEWAERFEARGICLNTYLWPSSPVVFPGIRRHSGTAEINAFKSRSTDIIAKTLSLDDNSYPKEIWSFALRGRKIEKNNPYGYALAHVLDHKDYGSRIKRELKGDFSKVDKKGFAGLYTSCVNTIWTPTSLLKPTDHNTKLRSLINQIINNQYKDVCEILPYGLEFISDTTDTEWDLANFSKMPQPVGEVEFMPEFLNYRNGIIEKLLNITAG